MTNYWDEIAVAVIVALAAGYLIRRLFVRGGCGPCQGARCDTTASSALVQLEPPTAARRLYETEPAAPPKP